MVLFFYLINKEKYFYISFDRVTTSSFRLCFEGGGSKILSQKASLEVKKNDYKGTALVVEDEKHISQLIRTWLEIRGFNVQIAMNGYEALDMMSADSFDLITTDIKMPVMDGASFISKVKSNPSTYNIPLIVVSIVDKSDLGNFFADAYLKKPFDGLDLLNIVDTLV